MEGRPRQVIPALIPVSWLEAPPDSPEGHDQAETGDSPDHVAD